MPLLVAPVPPVPCFIFARALKIYDVTEAGHKLFGFPQTY